MVLFRNLYAFSTFSICGAGHRGLPTEDRTFSFFLEGEEPRRVSDMTKHRPGSTETGSTVDDSAGASSDACDRAEGASEACSATRDDDDLGEIAWPPVFRSDVAAFLLLDAARKIRRVNAVAEQMFRCEPRALIGLDVSTLVPDGQPIAGLVENARAGAAQIAGAENGATMILFRRIDGTFFPGAVSAQSFDHGAKRYAIVAISNRSEAEHYRTHFMQAERLRTLGQFAASIAHDFNNLLGSVLGSAQMLSLSLSPAGREQEYAKLIIKAGRRGRELVEQILLFSRRRELQIRPLRLGAVLEEIVGLIRPSLPPEITLSIDIAGVRDDTALADVVEVQQAIFNLTRNAAHAMSEEGGVVSITLKSLAGGAPLPAGRVVSGVVQARAYLCVTIADSGVGMTGEMVRRLGEPFFTTKSAGEGTGLGIAGVIRALQRAGGLLVVESAPGAGTSISLLFPTSDEMVEEMMEDEFHAPVGPELEGSERIMFVDDEETLVMLGNQMLSALGYSVTSFTDPAQALAAFKESPADFDVVITDNTMPGMSGEALAAELRKTRADVPVVICTGYGVTADEAAKRAATPGMLRLAKPFSIKRLAQTVRASLGDKAS